MIDNDNFVGVEPLTINNDLRRVYDYPCLFDSLVESPNPYQVLGLYCGCPKCSPCVEIE